MRALVLFLTLVAAAFALAHDARAQEYMPNPFTHSSEPTMGPDHNYAFAPAGREFSLDEPSFRNEGFMLRTGSMTSVPVGNARLVSRNSSYYPVANTKVRYESLFIANRLNEHSVFMIGAWRNKLRTEGLQTLRTKPTYGFVFSTSF